MNIDEVRNAVIRTLCFHAVWRHLPTRVELLSTLDSLGAEYRESDISAAVDGLSTEGIAVERDGRIGLAEFFVATAEAARECERFQPRKRRQASRVAAWLSRWRAVRFVALANTTALGDARDEGDLDFFVVVRHGSLWSTRLFLGGVFKLLGMLPSDGHTRDTVCLSYFITDRSLDLSSHMLPGDDPYFRYWFMSLLPLFDDGIGEHLWAANRILLARHAAVKRWIAPSDFVLSPAVRLPLPTFAESVARKFQIRWFPSRLKELMNRDTRVMVGEDVLKMHVTDRREKYRVEYESLCRKYGVAP